MSLRSRIEEIEYYYSKHQQLLPLTEHLFQNVVLIRYVVTLVVVVGREAPSRNCDNARTLIITQDPRHVQYTTPLILT